MKIFTGSSMSNLRYNAGSTSGRGIRTGLRSPRNMNRSSRVGVPGVLLVIGVLALLVGAEPAVSGVYAETGWTPPSADSLTSSYEVDGIKVIHRRVTANHVVAANLYLLGGSRQVTRENAGIEAMLMEVSSYGTKTSTRDNLLRRLARQGTSIDLGATVDWTVFGIRATTPTFDSTWAIFADRLINPLLESSAVELVRAQMLAGASQLRDDPDALLEYLADSVNFAGHPYAIPPGGSEYSLARITRAQLQEYHQSQIVKSRMLLVVVGNVERGKIEQLIRGSLGKLPAGNYKWSLPDSPASDTRATVFAQRPLPTNYILGYFHGPRADSPDYAALRIASAILSGQLFAEIRSRRNLTYAVDAPFVERAIASGGIYVTAVDPNLTLRLISEQIEALQQGDIDPEGLSKLVLQFLTEYFMNNETNAAQASFLARAELYAGDYRKAETFVDDLRAVRPADIRSVARKYMTNFRFAYIGDSTKVSREVFNRY